MLLNPKWSYQYTTDEIDQVINNENNIVNSKLEIDPYEHLKDWRRYTRPGYIVVNGKPFIFPKHPADVTPENEHNSLKEQFKTALNCSDKLAEQIIKENHQSGYPYLMYLQTNQDCHNRGYSIFEVEDSSKEENNRHFEFNRKGNGEIEQRVTFHLYKIFNNGDLYESKDPIFSVQSTYAISLNQDKLHYSVINHHIKIFQEKLYNAKGSPLDLVHVFPEEFKKRATELFTDLEKQKQFPNEYATCRQTIACHPLLRQECPQEYKKIKRDITIAIGLTLLSALVFFPLAILVGILYRNEFKNLYGIITTSSLTATLAEKSSASSEARLPQPETGTSTYSNVSESLTEANHDKQSSEDLSTSRRSSDDPINPTELEFLDNHNQQPSLKESLNKSTSNSIDSEEEYSSTENGLRR